MKTKKCTPLKYTVWCRPAVELNSDGDHDCLY